MLDVVDGVLSHLDYPQLAIRRRRAGGRDLLVLHGAEPDFRWKQLADDVMEFALTHGVVEWVSIGAVPAAVPHTRPVPVFATASDGGLLRHGETQGPDGLLRVPAAALSVVEMGVGGAGIPTTGFYAQVPPYVGGPYAAGTIALVEHVARHLEIEVPLGSLMDEANAQRIGLDTRRAVPGGDPRLRHPPRGTAARGRDPFGRRARERDRAVPPRRRRRPSVVAWLPRCP